MPLPTTAIPARRRTVRVVAERVAAREARAQSAARPGLVVVVVAAAVTEGGAAGRRGSYPVLVLDPLVDFVPQLGVFGAGRVRAVQVGAIGLTAETVPKPPSGQQHQHRCGTERD